MRRFSLIVASLMLVALTGSPRAQTSTWRPAVLSDNGMIASGHALASETGIRMLQRGGNAVDAALAAWAVQGLTEPEMTGLGGDMFILIYLAKTGEVKFINGIGLRAHGRDGGLLQEQGRFAERRSTLGERAGRGRRRGARGEDLRNAGRWPRCWRPRRGSRRARVPDQRSARRRAALESRQAGERALVAEDLVQRRSPARDGRARRAAGPRGDAARDRRERERSVLSGRHRAEVRRLHEEPPAGWSTRRTSPPTRRTRTRRFTSTTRASRSTSARRTRRAT